MSGIVIDNIGPIEHLELDAKPGTITVFRGMNGEGKSTVLDAVSAVTRGNGRLESRDGTTGGSVCAFGVTIKVGRGGANRRTGDLVVMAVEDRLSIADFVEPGLKDPNAADARRMKALVSLAGVKADATLFHTLAGGAKHFEEIALPDTLSATDPILMAERVKRDFESQARIQTTRAERLWGEVKAKNAANDGLDLDAEHDTAKLQKRLETCLTDESAMKQAASLARFEADKRAQAKLAIELARSKSTSLTVPEASNAVHRAEGILDEKSSSLVEAEGEANRLKEQLQYALGVVRERQLARDAAQASADSARRELSAAEEREQTLQEWQHTLDQAAVVGPSDDDLKRAKSAVESARKAHEQGVLIRVALQRQREAEGLDRDREAAVKRADFLRNAAQSVLDVLAESVKGLVPGLKLDNQLRITVPHRKRQQCFYADLSHGERWTLALDIAVAAFQRRGERGVMAIPQEAWEGIDGRNRKVIAEHIAKTDLIVFTAEAERSLKGADGIEVEVIGKKAK